MRFQEDPEDADDTQRDLLKIAATVKGMTENKGFDLAGLKKPLSELIYSLVEGRPNRGYLLATLKFIANISVVCGQEVLKGPSDEQVTQIVDDVIGGCAGDMWPNHVGIDVMVNFITKNSNIAGLAKAAFHQETEHAAGAEARPQGAMSSDESEIDLDNLHVNEEATANTECVKDSLKKCLLGDHTGKDYAT